ncbi:hypothetical protein OSB04_030573 [Centaurea solstitialis]|uniref:Uncharacterized protein n=1 Tax=Centaurea solstitialis TaxID=347529 RepID=A0AA38S7V8_9ASTR|nr:hypothetical protein OSB04_030573 [Centaurea solstitialis]
MATTSHPPSTTNHHHHRPPQTLPDFQASIKLKYVKLGYHYLITHLFTLLLLPLIAVTAVYAAHHDVTTLYAHLRYHLIAVVG